jgi:hypothetical protein
VGGALRFDELALALCIEAGKPIRDARGEVPRLIDTFRVASEEAVRIGGEVMDLTISARAEPAQASAVKASSRARRDNCFMGFDVIHPDFASASIQGGWGANETLYGVRSCRMAMLPRNQSETRCGG